LTAPRRHINQTKEKKTMMKKLTVVLACASIVAAATAAFAGGGAATGLTGSMHDINYAGGGTYQKDVFGRSCAFCHTPHNAMGSLDNIAPLWNHIQSTVTPDPYVWASPANAAITINDDPLVGPSRLCMACHDGVTAVDSHGSAGSQAGTTALRASYADAYGNDTKRYIDDLTVTHPIGFRYDDAIAKRNGGTVKELIDKTVGFINTPVDSTFDTINRTNGTTSKTIGNTLYNGFFTCASCHDVHNTQNAKPDAGHNYNYFLYAKEEGSAICLSCHIK
jgi:hypothetical protein